LIDDTITYLKGVDSKCNFLLVVLWQTMIVMHIHHNTDVKISDIIFESI